ncbi:MAG: hypothetical protein J6J86_05810 [Lachnospiraceae bacterium]|nr:hypothetical protein [Lachnospiraceae bacterium]
MRKFEVGKKYRVAGMVFEVLSRTEKNAKLALIQHEGKFNEKVTDIKRVKINNWESITGKQKKLYFADVMNYMHNRKP